MSDHAATTALLQVMTICKILEGILPKESVRGAPPPDKKLLEYHFVFACVWAFGSCMLVDKVGRFGTSSCKPAYVCNLPVVIVCCNAQPACAAPLFNSSQQQVSW